MNSANDPPRDHPIRPDDPQDEPEGGPPSDVASLRHAPTHGVERLLERSFTSRAARLIGGTDGLRVRRTVGPVKARVLDPAGRPAGPVPVRVEVRRGGDVVAAREVTASPSGYVTADLSGVEMDDDTEVRILPMVAQKKRRDGPMVQPAETLVDLTTLLNGDATTVVVDPDRMALEDRLELMHRWRPPTFLDAADAANAPELFAPTVIEKNGNCSLDYQSEIALRSQTFHQVVRLEDPGTPRTGAKTSAMVERLSHPYPRGLDYPFTADGNHPVQAWKAVPGLLNVYTQWWRRVGHGLGSLLYSLALAPCEQTNIAIIDWERRERARRAERTEADEDLSHEIRRERSVSEAVDSVLDEVQSGRSSSSQASAGLSLGPIVLGGGGGSSRSRSEGTRTLTVNTAQELADATHQQGASMRSLRSTVVTQATTREREEITTRTVRNHNRNHALTVQYFQVVEHYVVETELSQQVDVLLVPYLVPGALWTDFPTFEETPLDPNNATGPAKRSFTSNALTTWLDLYGERLRPVLPRKHREGLDALHRLMHTPEIYEADEAGVTVSRWTLEMEGGLVPGLRFRITTTRDGSYTLRPRRAENGASHFVATTSPVPLDQIATLTVTFDADEAVRAAVRKSTDRFGGPLGDVVGAALDAVGAFVEEAVEAAARFRLDSVRLVAHTDPTRWLARPASVEVANEAPGVMLSASNASHPVSLSPPTLDLLQTAGARYRDYDRARRMARHVRSHAMAYLKHLWMTENSEERALRFDRYEYGGEPLLGLIENKPVGMIGNHVAFRLLSQGQLAEARTDGTVNFSRLVTLPTDGVFAETFLSKCNATEVRDVDRMVDPSTGCQDQAPQITGITPGTRAGATIPTAGSLPSNVLNIQTAPGAPDPTGMAAAAQIMSQPDIFRDMSLGQATVEAVRTLSQQAMVTSGENQRAAIEALTKLLPMALGMPPAPGGDGGSGGQTVASGGSGSGGSGGAARTVAQGLVDQTHRASSPVRQRDHEQVIRQSDMTPEAKKRALEALHNARTGAEAGADTKAEGDAPADSDRQLESRKVGDLPGPDDERRLVAQIFFGTREPGGDRIDQQLAALDAGDRAVLDQLRDPDWPHVGHSTWEVHGFADARGDRTGEEPALNADLSRQRAEAVVGYLTDGLGTGDVFGSDIEWRIKAHGDQFSDPQQRDQFPYDRRVDVYVTVGEAPAPDVPFTEDDVGGRLQRNLTRLADDLAGGVRQDVAWLAENEIMLYAKAKEMLALLRAGERLEPRGDPILSDLRFMLNNQETGALNLERLMRALRQAGRPQPHSDFETHVGMLLWTINEQNRKASDPFYRIVYLSPLEGKDPDPPFFDLNPEPHEHDDFPAEWDDLADDLQQAVIDAGARDQYVSGADHRARMQPHLDRRQALVDEAKARLGPFPDLKEAIENNPSNWWLR